MKFTQRLSLRVRLTLIFLILASVTWLLSSFVAWKQTTDNVDELFDTQLMLFAKRLSTLDLNEINAADRMAQTPNKLKHGHVDDDALTLPSLPTTAEWSLTMAITEKIFPIAISGKVLLTGNWSVKTIPGVLSG